MGIYMYMYMYMFPACLRQRNTMVRVCTYICDIGSSMIVEMQKEGRSKQGHANNKAKQHNTTILYYMYVIY